MLIDLDRKFVLLHPMKTGGTSLSSVIAPQVAHGEIFLEGQRKHWPLRWVEFVYSKLPDDWRIGCTVRNPWNLAASNWLYHLYWHSKSPRDPGWAAELKRVAETPFPDYVQTEYLDRPDILQDWTDGRATHVVRMEHMQQDADAMCTSVGYQPRSIPHLNLNQHMNSHRDLYKQHPKLIEAIGVVYERYNQKFGYVY